MVFIYPISNPVRFDMWSFSSAEPHKNSGRYKKILGPLRIPVFGAPHAPNDKLLFAKLLFSRKKASRNKANMFVFFHSPDRVVPTQGKYICLIYMVILIYIYIYISK